MPKDRLTHSLDPPMPIPRLGLERLPKPEREVDGLNGRKHETAAGTGKSEGLCPRPTARNEPRS